MGRRRPRDEHDAGVEGPRSVWTPATLPSFLMSEVTVVPVMSTAPRLRASAAK